MGTEDSGKPAPRVIPIAVKMGSDPISDTQEIGSDPISPAGACEGAEPFALMVLGNAMLPEFEEGDVIVIEPEGLATDGSYVLAHAGGEWTFRQLVAQGQAWELRALAPGLPVLRLDDLAAVRGVVIQKSRPGRRRATKRYVP